MCMYITIIIIIIIIRKRTRTTIGFVTSIGTIANIITPFGLVNAAQPITDVTTAFELTGLTSVCGYP